MVAALVALLACARAGMPTLQDLATLLLAARLPVRRVANAVARYLLLVPTFQLHIHFHHAEGGAEHATHHGTGVAALQRLLTWLLADELLRVLIARHHLLVLTRRDDFLQQYRAFWTFLVAERRTSVPQLAEDLRTRLQTLELLVVSVIRVTGARADMAAGQAEVTRQLAAPLRHLLKVIATRNRRTRPGVVLTAQRQLPTRPPVLSEGVQDVAPQLNSAKHSQVPDAVETLLSSGQGYTHPVRDLQETHASLRVAANQRQQDDVILLALILVHHVNLNPSELSGRQKFAKTVQLPCIGGKNGDL